MKFLNKVILMTIQEMINEHVKKKCKYCDIQNCNGVHITKDRKTSKNQILNLGTDEKKRD